MAPVEIDSTEAADELGRELGLPLTREGEGWPVAFPAAAPFSPTVVGIVRALRRWVGNLYIHSGLFKDSRSLAH